MMTDDERAIRGVVEQWLAASRAHDLDTLLSLMTDDVIFMVPDSKPFGKERFAAAAASMKDVKVEAAGTIEELQVLGDGAYIRNYLEVSITPPNGITSRRSGYTLTILRRQPDGRWRLARDANLVTASR
jgi:uncharacterized protein (TIGR02246 family)